MADVETPVDVSVVTIGGNDYTVYGTVARGDIYFAGRLGVSVWDALTTDEKGSALHMARQAIDRVDWAGAKTVAAQPTAWPRSGLTDKEGVAVPSATVPLDVEFAEYELALAYATNPTAFLATTDEQKEKRLKAGSAEVEFFASSSQAAGQFPEHVQLLIAIWLESGDDSVVGVYSGDSDLTTTFDPEAYDLNQGY
jgi:hypothetical protein